MRAAVAPLALSLALLAGCVTSVAGVKERKPHATYTSSRSAAAIAQCIGQMIPGASVLPGETEMVVNVLNPEQSILVSWIVQETLTGSRISVWRANSPVGGVKRAESCY
jgi:hypothetical protein